MHSVFKEALITVAVLAISAPAMAGTVVTNATTTRNTHGTGNSEFSSLRNSVGRQDNYSQSLKMESYAPSASASVTFNGGNFYGNAWGSTSPTNPDPWALGSYAEQRETVNYTSVDSARGSERFNFTENSYRHDVSSDSGW